jgi:5-hydroxyisourate hydrolase
VAVSSISTHVLDLTAGRPATGVRVTLTDVGGGRVAEGVTNDDGRVPDLADGLGPGGYRLEFDLAGYFEAPFVTAMTVHFEVTSERHHHVPLLVTPYAASTYLGS